MPKRPYELTSASPAEPPRLMHRCRPSSFRKLNSGTFPTSALADGDSGKDMPFRFLDVDAQVDLVRGVAHLVFQNDLNFFFRRVVRLEQAWDHVRRARTSDTEDAWVLIGNGLHIGWVTNRLRVVSSQPAIAGCGGGSHGGHLGRLTAGIVRRQ